MADPVDPFAQFRLTPAQRATYTDQGAAYDQLLRGAEGWQTSTNTEADLKRRLGYGSREELDTPAEAAARQAYTNAHTAGMPGSGSHWSDLSPLQQANLRAEQEAELANDPLRDQKIATFWQNGAPMPQQPTLTDPFQPFGQGAKQPAIGAVPFAGQMANLVAGGPGGPTDTNPAGAPSAIPPTFGDLGPIEQPNPEGLPPVDRSGPGGPSTFTPMGGPGEAPAAPMARPTSATGFIGRGVGRLGRQVNAFRGMQRFRPVKPRQPMTNPLGTAAVPAAQPANVPAAY